MKVLEKALEGKKFLVGDRMTLADIVLFRYIRLFMIFHFPDGLRKKVCPNVTNWFENIMKTNEAIKAYGKIILCKQPIKPFMGKINRKPQAPKVTKKTKKILEIKKMDASNPTMKNIQAYLTQFVKNRCELL